MSTLADAAMSENVFRAVADPTRQRLLRLLLQEELNVSELVDILEQPQSTVSRHLHILRAAGLAKDRRQGTSICYSAGVSAPAGDDDAMSLVTDWLRRRPLPQALQVRLEKALQRRRDETLDFFQRLGHRWDALRQETFGEAFAFEAFLALLPQEWTVVDLGAGTGFLLPALARNFQHVVAIEPTPAMLECARQRVADRQLDNVSFQQEDLSQLSLREQSCDLATACLVLHHVADPAKAIRETFRVLRPGGWLLLIEQAAHELAGFREQMQDRLWGFEPQALCREVTNCGFDGVRPLPLREPRGPGSPVEAPGLFVITGRRPDR